MIKVFVKSGFENYASFINIPFKIVELIKDADVVILTGGHDVSPKMYDEKRFHPYTTVNKQEDDIDAFIYEKAVKLNKFVIGICKGSQLSCAMNGGRVIQHVNGHATGMLHSIITNDKKEFLVTSTHHQMMYPFDVDKEKWELIAASKNKLSDVYFKNDVEVFNPPYEPEIIWWKDTKTFSVQPHPEMMPGDDKFVVWLNNLIWEKYNSLCE